MVHQPTAARMKADTVTLGELFGEQAQFAVPDYQRKYVWEQAAQWEPLWDDIQTLVDRVLDGEDIESAPPHFMGAIVLMPHEYAGSIEVFHIVDGQQRIITLQLVLDAAHACVGPRTAVRRRLGELVINRGHDADDSRFDFKVWPWDDKDRAAFSHAMRDELSTEDHDDSSVAKAHNYFADEIRKWIAAGPQAESQRASALGQVLSQLLRVVSIKLAAADDAQLIFETLNARGTPLGTFDLLKNYIHRAAKDHGLSATTIHNRHLRHLDARWWDKQTGSGSHRKSHIDSFLYHWLMMKTGETSTSIAKVFAGIRTYIEETRQGDVETVAEELGNAARIYQGFHKGDDFAEFNDYIRRWRTTRGDALTPLMLWLWGGERPMSKAQRGRALQALDSFLVRRLVCGLPTRAYGDLCRELLTKVKNARSRSPDAVIIGDLQRRKADASRWPPDKEFREKFAEPNKLTAGRRRMILEALECHLPGSEWRSRSAELAQVRGLTIEHVLPRQSDTAAYRGPGYQAHGGNEALIESFGNLTLLESYLNSRLSNQSSWEAKSHAYLNDNRHDLALNRDLVRGGGRRKSDSLNDWTDREIKRRSKRLAKLAIEIWPRGRAL